jgi:hypothetical protein
MNEAIVKRSKEVEIKDHRGKCNLFQMNRKKRHCIYFSVHFYQSLKKILNLLSASFAFLIAVNIVYKRAIIRAIDELQDFNLRSNIDAIRRHVESSLGPEHGWNDTIFLKTLKGLTNNGDIEQCATVNCGLTHDFKERRTKCVKSLLEKRSQLLALPPYISNPSFQKKYSVFHEKTIPVRNEENAELKIISKKIYDSLQ